MLHGFSLFLSLFFIGMMLYAFKSSQFFLRSYKSNIRYFNTYLSKDVVDQYNLKLTKREKRRYYDTPWRMVVNYVYNLLDEPNDLGPAISLLLQAVLALSVERLSKALHAEISRIKFRVNTYGDSRFVFDIQGEGIIAVLFRLLLGGFIIHTSICGTADTARCEGGFLENDLATWITIFALAAFFAVHGMFKQKSNLILSRMCDFIDPVMARKRADHCIGVLEKERDLMGFITDKFAEEELQRRKMVALSSKCDEPVYRKAKVVRLLRFYRNPRPYYRFLPVIALSIIAHVKYDVDDIMCMICSQGLIVGRYSCNTLLFCEDCRAHLKKCPCDISSCNNTQQKSVYR